MNNQTIVMCVVALLLGMLLFHMLKGVCGCKVVEGQGDGPPPASNTPSTQPADTSPTGEQGQPPLLDLPDHIRHGSTQRSNLGCYDRCQTNRDNDKDQGLSIPDQIANLDACNANCGAHVPTHFESYEVDFDMEQYNQNLRSMDCGNEVFENFFNQSRQDCIISCQQVRHIDSGVLPPWDQGVCEQCCMSNAITPPPPPPPPLHRSPPFPPEGTNVDMEPSCEELMTGTSDIAVGWRAAALWSGCGTKLADIGIDTYGGDAELQDICRDSCDGTRGSIRY